MSVFMPIYANEDPNKDLNYSDCLKHLQIPQNIRSPFMFLGITHYLTDFLSQSKVSEVVSDSLLSGGSKQDHISLTAYVGGHSQMR